MRILPGLLLCLSLACATTPAPRSYYLMRDAVPDGVAPTTASAPIALGRIDVAPYLREPALVLETAPGEVRPARNHLWAEPLPDGVRLYLRDRISREIGSAIYGSTGSHGAPDTTVDVSLEQLHGTADGGARLVATWRVTPPRDSGEATDFRIARTRPLARAGYAALAEAEIALLGDLAAAIADSLREAP